ncbi:MAG: hypothetical protein ACRD1G_04310 [Acidimicrobiales bacterium]
MVKKRKGGRPGDGWKPEKDLFVRHAVEANVTEELLVEIRRSVHGFQNPVIRAQVTDAVLHMEEELRQARREALLELHSQLGWPWQRIGALLGLRSRQRAWQMGNGR